MSLDARKKAISLREIAQELYAFHGTELYDCRSDISAALRELEGVLVRTSNPWSPYCWNMTEQGRICRSDPKEAERLAAKWGKTIHKPTGASVWDVLDDHELQDMPISRREQEFASRVRTRARA